MKNKAEIVKELKELSSILYQMKQDDKQSFKLPENYFKQLKEGLFSSIEIGFDQEIGKRTFTVPNNYFDQLTDNVMSAVEAEEIDNATPKKEATIIELQSNRRREKTPRRKWYSMAASVAAVVFIMFYLGGLRNGNSDTIVATGDLTQEEALAYIDDNYSDFDEDDLFAFVDLEEDGLSFDYTDELEQEIDEYIEENIDEFEESLFYNEI